MTPYNFMVADILLWGTISAIDIAYAFKLKCERRNVEGILWLAVGVYHASRILQQYGV